MFTHSVACWFILLIGSFDEKILILIKSINHFAWWLLLLMPYLRNLHLPTDQKDILLWFLPDLSKLANHWEEGNWGKRQIPTWVWRGIGLAQSPNTPTPSYAAFLLKGWGVQWTGAKWPGVGCSPYPFQVVALSPHIVRTPLCLRACSLESAGPKVATAKSRAPAHWPSYRDLAWGEESHAPLDLLLFCILSACQ